MRSVHFTAHNDIKLLLCGVEYFPALIAAIDAAEYDIYFETYIFAGDQTGDAVRAALIRASARGVSVRMITDWFGTGRVQIARMSDELAQTRVRHRIFNPWFRRGVTRSHRKICVVDRVVALVGGININDDMYCDYDHRIALTAPRWDFAVEVRGPLVAAIHLEAQTQWLRLGKLGLVKRLALFRDLRAVSKQAAKNPMLAGFVVRDNLRNRRTIQRAYLQALRLATKSVLLANPYFAPGRRFREALAVAARRGVNVTLLIGVGEVWLQDVVAHSFYPQLLAAGVNIVEYRKTQLHGKVAVIDDDWATVGSSNFDGLSLLVNQEANVVIKDATFALNLRAHIEQAVSEGVIIHQHDFAHIGRVRRFGYEMAFLVYKLAMRIVAIGKYT
jgi:cardiolipin synthase